MTQPAHWRPVEATETGLRGRVGRLLTDDPTDDAGWPADLPPGTREVVFADDTPNPNATLMICTPDGSRTARVRFDQLVITDQPARR